MQFGIINMDENKLDGYQPSEFPCVYYFPKNNANEPV